MNEQEKNQQEIVLTKAHHEHEKSLEGYAFFKLGDRALSEDLVQNTFMKTWKYQMKGQEILKMKAFLFKILNNLIVDEYRKKKTSSLDTLVEKGFDPKQEQSRHIFDILDGNKAILLIKKLSKPYQKIMHMRFVKDLSLDEMSQETSQSKNSLAVQIHRGLKKLKLLYYPKPKKKDTNKNIH